MIKYLLKVTNKLIILKSYTQVKLAQYQGSKGHNTTSDVPPTDAWLQWCQCPKQGTTGCMSGCLRSPMIRGPAQNLSNFQTASIPILSVLTSSTSSPHDILKVSRKIIDRNPPVGRDKCDDWVLGGISCQNYVGFLLVGGELSLMTHFFSQYIPLFMILICWWIGWIEWLQVSWKKSIGKCLFSVKKSYLVPIFAFFTVFYLFPPPNTLISCYYYQILCLDVVDIHLLSIWHQDIWKKTIGFFLFIGFPLFFYPFGAFFNLFLPFFPCYTLFNSYYTPLLITLNMQSHLNSI
jgi:hypothetical protein